MPRRPLPVRHVVDHQELLDRALALRHRQIPLLIIVDMDKVCDGHGALAEEVLEHHVQGCIGTVAPIEPEGEDQLLPIDMNTFNQANVTQRLRRWHVRTRTDSGPAMSRRTIATSLEPTDWARTVAAMYSNQLVQ